MTVLITLSGVGSNAGPTFNLYESPDGINFIQFASDIDKTDLESGYQATITDGTTDIKVTSVGECINSEVVTISVMKLICGTWNSITHPETYYDDNGNLVTYQVLNITGGAQFDFHKLFLPGETINTAQSTAKVLSYTTQTATNLIANTSELPTPQPWWEGVLYETTDTNTIYMYSVDSNTWVPIPYGQETTTYAVDPVTWKINFDYTPQYIGTIGDPLALETPGNIQNTNIHPILTMTLGGNIRTTGGRIISINYTSTYTSILQVFESESNDCQNFRPTISGNLCGYWESRIYPMAAPQSENRIDGYIDFGRNITNETIDPANSWVRVRSFITLYGGGSTIPNDSSGDLTFDESNRGYISQASIVVFQVDDPSGAMTLYFEGYITTYEGTIYTLSNDTYSDYTDTIGLNTLNQCEI